jgi:hypothetical protein
VILTVNEGARFAPRVNRAGRLEVPFKCHYHTPSLAADVMRFQLRPPSIRAVELEILPAGVAGSCHQNQVGCMYEAISWHGVHINFVG